MFKNLNELLNEINASKNVVLPDDCISSYSFEEGLCEKEEDHFIRFQENTKIKADHRIVSKFKTSNDCKTESVSAGVIPYNSMDSFEYGTHVSGFAPNQLEEERALAA